MYKKKSCAPGADVVEPARAGPGPGHDNRVDERTHREAEEDVPHRGDELWMQKTHLKTSADQGCSRSKSARCVHNIANQPNPPAQLLDAPSIGTATELAKISAKSFIPLLRRRNFVGIEAPRPSVVTAGNSSAPAQVEALRHSATDDGGRRRRERELEVPVQVRVVRRDNAGDAVLLDEADGEEPRGQERPRGANLEWIGDQRAPYAMERIYVPLRIARGVNIDPARHTRHLIRPAFDTKARTNVQLNPMCMGLLSVKASAVMRHSDSILSDHRDHPCARY